ncbi:MAG: OmpA/MotB family protein, partial [Bdellovibrionales bacterium]
MLEANGGGHDEEGDEGGDEIWLISYSDLMTLLFGFFVLMYAFALAKTGAQVESVKEGVARSFGGSYVAPYKNLQAKVEDLVIHEPKLQDVSIQKIHDGLEITFQSGLLFTTGSAEIEGDAKDPMRRMAQLIASNIEDSDIMVEGHTDDVPIHNEYFPSNWELSGARASAVVREFVKYGYDPKKLMAVGYADSQPLLP